MPTQANGAGKRMFYVEHPVLLLAMKWQECAKFYVEQLLHTATSPQPARAMFYAEHPRLTFLTTRRRTADRTFYVEQPKPEQAAQRQALRPARAMFYVEQKDHPEKGECSTWNKM